MSEDKNGNLSYLHFSSPIKNYHTWFILPTVKKWHFKTHDPFPYMISQTHTHTHTLHTTFYEISLLLRLLNCLWFFVTICWARVINMYKYADALVNHFLSHFYFWSCVRLTFVVLKNIFSHPRGQITSIFISFRIRSFYN